MGILVNKENFLCIFYPGKLLFYIAPLLVVLEQLSYMVKPFSLFIRIFANMLAGHILVHILSTYGYFFFLKKFIVFFLILDSLLVLLNVMESFISIVQPLIFVSLTALFFNDILLPLNRFCINKYFLF